MKNNNNTILTHICVMFYLEALVCFVMLFSVHSIEGRESETFQKTHTTHM